MPFPLLSATMTPAIVQQAGVDFRYAGEAVFLLGLAWGIMKWLKQTIFDIEEPPDTSGLPTTVGEYLVQASRTSMRRPARPAPRASSSPAKPLTTEDWTRLGITTEHLACMTPRELEFFLASVHASRAAAAKGDASDAPDATPGAGPPRSR